MASSVLEPPDSKFPPESKALVGTSSAHVGELGVRPQRLLPGSAGKHVFSVNNRNLPAFRKCSGCVKTLRGSASLQALRSRPQPTPLGRCHPRKKRHQREASSASGHFIPQDITGYLSRRSRSVLVLRKVCTFEIGGQFLPGHGHRGVSAAQAREANSSSARRPRSRTRGRPARAQPGMHALWSRAESGAPAAVPRGPGPPHTDSSVDSSSGLMYSNPSNSDWSILLMTSSSSGVSCTGSLVNCVSKLSRP